MLQQLKKDSAHKRKKKLKVRFIKNEKKKSALHKTDTNLLAIVPGSPVQTLDEASGKVEQVYRPAQCLQINLNTRKDAKL